MVIPNYRRETEREDFVITTSSTPPSIPTLHTLYMEAKLMTQGGLEFRAPTLQENMCLSLEELYFLISSPS